MDEDKANRMAMILRCLPEPKEREWAHFTKWEQRFIPSVRRQFIDKGTLSEDQYLKLEEVWKRINNL